MTVLCKHPDWQAKVSNGLVRPGGRFWQDKPLQNRKQRFIFGNGLRLQRECLRRRQCCTVGNFSQKKKGATQWKPGQELSLDWFQNPDVESQHQDLGPLQESCCPVIFVVRLAGSLSPRFLVPVPLSMVTVTVVMVFTLTVTACHTCSIAPSAKACLAG